VLIQIKFGTVKKIWTYLQVYLNHYFAVEKLLSMGEMRNFDFMLGQKLNQSVAFCNIVQCNILAKFLTLYLSIGLLLSFEPSGPNLLRKVREERGLVLSRTYSCIKSKL
jgi:hypothetical protein